MYEPWRTDVKHQIKEIKCPICKKIFIPAPEHAWKIGFDRSVPKLVCTYSCMRVWEKAHGRAR